MPELPRTLRVIEDQSDRPRLPRLGKLSLGRKVRTRSGAERPTEVDHFVCPEPLPPDQADPVQPWRSDPNYPAYYEKFRSVYGDAPKALDIIIPHEETSVWFPRALRLYGKNGRLKCTGDGLRAMRRGSMIYEEGTEEHAIDDWYDIQCDGPECEYYGQGGCGRAGNLFVFLPRVTMCGFFQIDTGSITAMTDIDGDLWLVKQLFGRVSNLVSRRPPYHTALILTREQKGIMHQGKRMNHWPMRIRIRDGAMLDLPRLASYRIKDGAGFCWSSTTRRPRSRKT